MKNSLADSAPCGVDKSTLKLQLLFRALREAALIAVAALEDYLDVAYDKSALAKRRAKVKEA